MSRDDGEPKDVSRRKYLTVAGGLTATVGLSGCLDLITGGTTEFDASPSRVNESALDETGYEFTGLDEVVIEREFEAAGETETVIVTNLLAEHEKALGVEGVAEQAAAIFTSLTTPQVRVLGQEFNPVDEMSTTELAEMVQDQYDGIENIRHQEDSEVTVYGETTTQSRFTADALAEGSPVDLILHISEAVEMGDDFVVAIGGYPDVVMDEEANILTLMEGVEPAD